MNLAAVDLNQLRALEALLSTRSVTVAARQLGVTQAAASNVLRRLRELFSDPLLVRAGQQMTLTPRALGLRTPVAEVMRAIGAVLSTEPRFDPATTQVTVPVATSDHVDLVLLSRVEALLAREAPGINLHVLPYNVGATEDLRLGKVEMVMSPLHERAPDLSSELLFEDRLVWVMRADHPARKAPASAKAFAGLRHLLVSPRGLSGGPVDRALAKRGLTRRIARTMPHFGAALLLISGSDLVAALPQHLVDSHRVDLKLTWRPLPLVVPPVRIYSISHRRNHNDPQHQYFRATVRRAAEDLLGARG